MKLNFIKKKQKSLFEPLLGGLRGNVRTSSIARRKARSRLPIRHNRTFLRYLLRLKRYQRKSVEVGVFRRGRVDHFECKFQTERGIAHQPLLVS